jgi:peptidoglycan/LPS O-acetylase OafA/YrhL
MLSFTGVADEWLGFGIGVMWTLYVEFWFYILVPLVFIAARTTKLRLIALAVLSLASTIFLFVFLNAPNMPKLVTYFMPIYALTWMTPLLFGAIVAIKPPGRIPFMRTTWLCLGALILITLFVSNDERQIVWPVEAIAAAAIASVWIAAWHANDVKVPASPISFIGKISYSIYLLHGIALDWMDKIPWPFGTASPLEWSKTWAIIAVVLVASTGMYYAIEAPAQRIGKQLAKLIRIKGSPQGPLALQAR